MDWNKIPRWMLILLAALGIGSTTLLVQTARADLDKFRAIAYQAKSNADDAIALGSDLKIQLSEVRVAQETFRKEYREDQKDLDKKLVELLRAVKA